MLVRLLHLQILVGVSSLCNIFVSPVIVDQHNIILYAWLLCRRINIKLVVSLGTPTVYIHHDVYLGPWYSGTIGPYLTEVIRCIQRYRWGVQQNIFLVIDLLDFLFKWSYWMTRKVVLKNGRLASEVVHGFDVLYDEPVIGKK